jgi:hypothetical protein
VYIIKERRNERRKGIKMDKETHKKLTANFPKSVVKKAPQGKFGDYVPHHIYTKRLVDVVGGKYNFTYDIIRDKDNAVVGAKCTLEIDDLGTVQEVGDVDRHALARNLTESEILKLAVSDGIKRCCMRFGIGLELWTGDTTEEEHYAGSTEETPKKKQVTQESGISPSKPKITEATLKQMVFTSCNDNKDFAIKCYKDCMNRTIIKTNQSDIALWEDETIKIFLDLVDDYISKHEETFKDRESNEPVVNMIIEELGEVEEKKVEEKDMADIPEGKWMEDPISEGQIKFIETLIKQAIDSGQDKLGAEAKQYLNSGEATKGNASSMIDKLKDALS